MFLSLETDNGKLRINANYVVSYWPTNIKETKMVTSDGTTHYLKQSVENIDKMLTELYVTVKELV